MAYQASNKEEELKIINIDGLEQLTKENMEIGAFGYIRGGAESEITYLNNEASFKEKTIYPRIMKGIENVEIKTSLLGIELATPILVAPEAGQGLCHVDAEEATIKAAEQVNTIFCLSTYGNRTVEQVSNAAPQAKQFFQIYLQKDDSTNKAILDYAMKENIKAIIITADATVGGYRELDVINDFKFPLAMPILAQVANHDSGDGSGKGIATIYANAKQTISVEDIKMVKEYTKLPVIVKGIQHPDDAYIAIEAGASAIWVSNHGGRQLDGGPASFEVLPEIAKVVNKQVPIIFDSGIRRGEHIFKALASGADVVAIGRPILYGLNLGGSKGVKSVFEHFNKELKITMQLAGTKTIEDIKKTKLRDK